MTSKTTWPVATNPLAERMYLDPGAIYVLGGPTVLSVPRQPATGTDSMGREHPANDWFMHFDGAASDDGATYLTDGTSLDVVCSPATRVQP